MPECIETGTTTWRTLGVQAFVVKHYQPRVYDFPEFEDTFRSLLREAEAAADLSKHAPVQRKQLAGGSKKVSGPRARLCEQPVGRIVRTHP